MKKHNTATWRLPLAALFAFACSRGPWAPREIRAHTRVISGVAHAEPAKKAERYCAYCHGSNLAGGKGLEPSCYTCHGKTWLDEPGSPSAAPLSHSVIHGGFHHDPGRLTPETGCVACHGSDLLGNAADGSSFPGCTLCHGELWK